MAGNDVQKNFFYAVAGASTNPDKFGYKLVAYYKSRGLPVVPVTLSSRDVLGIAAISSIKELDAEQAEQTSLSIVTPPAVSLGVLKQALEQKQLRGIWLQPGAEDSQVVKYITDNEWLKQRTVFGGPCVLVLGDRLRNEAQKL